MSVDIQSSPSTFHPSLHGGPSYESPSIARSFRDIVDAWTSRHRSTPAPSGSGANSTFSTQYTPSTDSPGTAHDDTFPLSLQSFLDSMTAEERKAQFAWATEIDRRSSSSNDVVRFKPTPASSWTAPKAIPDSHTPSSITDVGHSMYRPLRRTIDLMNQLGDEYQEQDLIEAKRRSIEDSNRQYATTLQDEEFRNYQANHSARSSNPTDYALRALTSTGIAQDSSPVIGAIAGEGPPSSSKVSDDILNSAVQSRTSKTNSESSPDSNAPANDDTIPSIITRLTSDLDLSADERQRMVDRTRAHHDASRPLSLWTNADGMERGVILGVSEDGREEWQTWIDV